MAHDELVEDSVKHISLATLMGTIPSLGFLLLDVLYSCPSKKTVNLRQNRRILQAGGLLFACTVCVLLYMTACSEAVLNLPRYRQ